MEPVSYRQAFRMIINAFKANKAVLVLGKFGMGKTALSMEVAKYFSQFSENYQYYKRMAIYDEPVDLRGVPEVKNGLTYWNPPAELPREGNGLFCADELTSAPPQTQAAYAQFLLEGRIAEYHVPKGFHRMATGNQVSDKSYSSRPPLHMVNRVLTIVLETSVEDWKTWAYGANINPLVSAFIGLRPDLLHTYDPKSHDLVFATPRSWEMLSDQLWQDPEERDIYPLASGHVGQGTAIEFNAFLKIQKDAPSVDDIIAKPDSHDIPSNPSILYATMIALGRVANKKNFKKIMAFTKRIREREFDALCVHSCVSYHPELAKEHDYIVWHARNKEYMYAA